MGGFLKIISSGSQRGRKRQNESVVSEHYALYARDVSSFRHRVRGKELREASPGPMHRVALFFVRHRRVFPGARRRDDDTDKVIFIRRPMNKLMTRATLIPLVTSGSTVLARLQTGY